MTAANKGAEHSLTSSIASQYFMLSSSMFITFAAGESVYIRP